MLIRLIGRLTERVRTAVAWTVHRCPYRFGVAETPPESLVELQRVAYAARREAEVRGVSPEAWRPWVESAAVVQNAIAEHAAAKGLDPSDLERAVEAAARRAESDDGA